MVSVHNPSVHPSDSIAFTPLRVTIEIMLRRVKQQACQAWWKAVWCVVVSVLHPNPNHT